jgi:hypothetical protein
MRYEMYSRNGLAAILGALLVMVAGLACEDGRPRASAGTDTPAVVLPSSAQIPTDSAAAVGQPSVLGQVLVLPTSVAFADDAGFAEQVSPDQFVQEIRDAASVPVRNTPAPGKTSTSPPEPPVFFIRQGPAVGERVVWEAELIGELVVERGCLRVARSNADTSYLPIWPPVFTLRIEANAVLLLDGAGDVVAGVGADVRVSGGEVRSAERLDERVRDMLKADCAGPYWVVGSEVGRAGDAAPATTEGADHSADTPAAGDALRRDAQSYASDMGVGLEEAIRRMELQDPIGDLNADLAVNERATFAGLWIEHTPRYRGIVMFTHDAEDTIQRYIEDEPLADIVEVRTAGATMSELIAAQVAANSAVREAGVSISSAINVIENRVELFATDPESVTRILREAGVRLPDHVEVVRVGTSATPGSDGGS